MEKLQPLIRNRFWILSGLALPLILYGFYSANSQLRAAITARETAIMTKFQAIPKGNEPNENFVDKLKEVNGFLDEAVDDAIVQLWKNQQKRMVWPASVASNIPAKFMDRFDAHIPAIYRSKFEEEFNKLMLRVQPVKPLDPLNPVPQAMINLSNQKVWLYADLPQPTFNDFSITSQDVWDAQIDVWLTQVLLDAIVRTNTEAQSINEAVVRRLDRLELMGGSGEPSTSDAMGGGDMMMGSGMMSSGGASGSMMGMGGGAQKKFLTGRGGMGGMGMSGSSGMSSASGPRFGSGGSGMKSMGGSQGGDPMSVPFDPAQELGPSGDATASGSMMSMMGSGGAMSGAMGESGEAAEPPSRYIGEDEETALYYQRGYYMSVIIKQSKVADFVAEMLNSDWPVQIKRFQVGRNPYRQAQSSSFGSYGSSGMASEFSMSSEGMSAGGLGSGSAFGGMSGLGSSFGSGGGSGMSSGGPRMGGMSGGLSMGSSRFGGSSMMGGSGAKLILNPYQQGLPARAMDALNDPDLVQLDLVGIITMYKQPLDVMEAIKAREEARQGLRNVPDESPSSLIPDETTSDAFEESPEEPVAPADDAEIDFDFSPDTEQPAIDGAMPAVQEDLGFDSETPVEFDNSLPALDEVEGTMPQPAQPSATPGAGQTPADSEAEENLFE